MNARVAITALSCVGIIVLGLGLATGIVALKPEVNRTTGEAPPSAVTVSGLSTQTTAIRVRATGTVEAAEAIDIVPEVTGRIVWRSPKLLPGGRFKKGEVLARIDGRQYALAVAQEKARVRTAELDLELEKGRGEVAAREWELLKGKEADPKRSPLALRVSQLEAAQVSLEGAKSGLARSQLDLERATLRAPFNATVISETLDLGQRVGTNASVARLVGVDAFWVRVGVRVEDLANIAVPGLNAEKGSNARIVQRLSNGESIERAGTVLRLVEELDPETRRAQLLVTVPDPLSGKASGLPLLPGAYVEVEITGREVEGVAKIPSRALYNGNTIWVVLDDKLQERTVRLQFADQDFSYVSVDFEPGTQLVTSPLPNPIGGMPVKAQSSATAARE